MIISLLAELFDASSKSFGLLSIRQIVDWAEPQD